MATFTTNKYCDLCQHLTHGRSAQCDLCPCTADYVSALACRCCGKVCTSYDGQPIHTLCIGKHWGKHYRGINATRCREFGKVTV